MAKAAGSELLVTLLLLALAPLGGPFVHDLQTAAAASGGLHPRVDPGRPRSCAPPRCSRSRFRWHAWSLAGAREQIGFLEIAVVVGAVLVALRAKPTATRATAVVAAVLATIVIATAIETIPRQKVGRPTTVAPMIVGAHDFGSADWAAYVSRDLPYSTPMPATSRKRSRFGWP